MASGSEGEAFSGFPEEEEERPGRAERARLICQLEDEMMREMLALAGTRLEESPSLNLEDEPPTQG